MRAHSAATSRVNQCFFVPEFARKTTGTNSQSHASHGAQGSAVCAPGFRRRKLQIWCKYWTRLAHLWRAPRQIPSLAKSLLRMIDEVCTPQRRAPALGNVRSELRLPLSNGECQRYLSCVHVFVELLRRAHGKKHPASQGGC